ncbi:uncharacterized protein [Amphiura filiformis]|uniref:uncharacterized protein n=1 Tax=Amphiura filiformis TaxID=82378 RepID=UPI003B22855B
MNQQILCTFLVFCLFTTTLSESLIDRLLDTKEKYRRMWETEKSGEELDEDDDLAIKRGRSRNVEMLARMHGTAGIAGKRSSPDFVTDYQILNNCPQLRSLLASAQPDLVLRNLNDVINMCETLQVFDAPESP